MTVTTTLFGTTRSGDPVLEYTLTNASGAQVCILEYGCTVQKILAPDAAGHLTEVCLYETPNKIRVNLNVDSSERLSKQSFLNLWQSHE